MSTASLAPSTAARTRARTHVSTARASLASLSKFAVLGWSALYVAYALRMVVDAGPHHLHEFVFVLGAITLALVFAWVMPFAGALMLGSAGTAVWMFLDATPANAWLAGAAYVAMGLTLARWVAESRQREA